LQSINCKNEYINQFLSEKEAILRQNNGEEPPREPANFVEKAIFKFLDKIFKKENKNLVKRFKLFSRDF
jgi:hypothetical protein